MITHRPMQSNNDIKALITLNNDGKHVLTRVYPSLGLPDNNFIDNAPQVKFLYLLFSLESILTE